MKIEEFIELLERWRIEKLPKLIYISERFDCDDFAACFQAFIAENSKKNACGRAMGDLCFRDVCGGHAWNFVIVEYHGDVVITCVEPQLGECVPCYGISSDGFMYKMKWIIG